MKTNHNEKGLRRVLITMIIYLSVILAAMLLGVTGQVAGWVAQGAVALCLFRLVALFSWGAAKNGYGWRV